MAEAKGNRFTKYFPLLLDALRSAHPNPMRPAEAQAWIRSRIDVPVDDLTRLVVNGKQSIYENDVHWARFYLVKSRLMYSPKRGLWALTSEGLATHLTPDQTRDLFVGVRGANKPETTANDEIPAPDIDGEDGEAYWFVGAMWNKTDDQLPRFIVDGAWENGYDDQYSELVRRMKPGDKIAVKASFVKSRGLPFDAGGKPVSVMRIKATGTILENLNDGKRVKVAWDPSFEPRDWYFYTYRTTVAEADRESEDARRLIDFAFRGAPQDYGWFLARPYWFQKYGATAETPGVSVSMSEDIEDAELFDDDGEPAYSVENIVAEGSFLTTEELQVILNRWKKKKNMVLQGPPGTGKTWLAKRLGFALLGSDDRETARSRLRVVQFHPSLAYEDFVRGWRPAGNGRLELVDGILMQSIDAASSEPDRNFVLVIEEINRGNPAQIFGEMLTLLEDSKRKRTEAIELAYRKPDERVYVPDNLYVIGTMNVADRSLAIVDLALRRRFAFVDLEPRFGPLWRQWCSKLGLDLTLLSEIETRIEALNVEIANAVSLGPQFRIGHSFVTPDEHIANGAEWFKAKVDTEVGPLLDEYWYDVPDRSKDARANLLAGLA